MAAGDEVSTLRQALRNTAAVGDTFTNFRRRREKPIEANEMPGVFNTQTNRTGGKQIANLGGTFAQGSDLCTVRTENAQLDESSAT